MDLTLVILAAGMGSRYGGLKQLDPMGPNGEKIIDYSIRDALRAGFTRVVFVIRKDFEKEFREQIGGKYEGQADVRYAFQQLADLPAGFLPPEGRAKPWGTGHAIWAARNEVDTPFLAINADDFYGAEPYRLVAKFFADNREPDLHAMAAFKLSNTLSEHGAVSRGVCRVDPAGLLTSVKEVTAIQRDESGVLRAGDETFAESTPVSLNFWGFQPGIFADLEDLFAGFLGLSGADPKAEFYIPTAVADLIAQGRARVRVLETESEWFGVTYPADKERVVASIRSLVG